MGIYFNPRPREEGDFTIVLKTVVQDDFNPRPREEGDQVRSEIVKVNGEFQSTPS